MARLRVAAHIHSAFSDDCDWPLDRICRTLRRQGYHGALVCEHDRGMTADSWERIREECARLSQSGFLVVPGIEYQDPTHTIHVPVYGPAPFLGSSPTVQDVLSHARAHAAIGVLAHPRRRDAYQVLTTDDLRLASGIEVWNRKYDGIRPNDWAFEQASTHGLIAFTALDFHGPRQFFPLSMDVRVEGEPTVSNVVSAIAAGAVAPTVLGAALEHALTGTIGTTARWAESTRARMAPGVRRLEAAVSNTRQRVPRLKR